MVPNIPSGAHCQHCGAEEAVVPTSNFEQDRFLYVCVHCGWWGYDPLQIQFSPKDEVQRASGSRARKR